MHPAPLICPIRGRSVPFLPEERVRVRLIHALLLMGYPKGGIAVEKELSQMPHLQSATFGFPQRRADLVCFASGIHPTEALYPLLLIECKGVPLTLRMRNQVIGYNHFLRAYFVALVNGTDTWLGWLDATSGEYQWISAFPSYADLLKMLDRSS